MSSRFGNMRLAALVSVVLCIVALVLSFLCLFAGSSKGFMEDYAIVTLNTSRIGENVVNQVANDLCSHSHSRRDVSFDAFQPSKLETLPQPLVLAARSEITRPPANPLAMPHHRRGIFSSVESEIHSKESEVHSKITSAASRVESAISSVESEAAHLCDEIVDDVGDKLEDVLQRIGLHDWYSAHVMDFCEGSYIPGPVPNATLKASSIHKNVTACSNRTALYHFDPKETIAEQINNATNGEINLTNLHWPSDITRGLNALRDAQKAVFILYCLAIAFITLSLLLAVFAIFSIGRLTALLNVGVECLAFLCSVLASAIVTVIAVKATNLINKYGKDVSVSANRGNKFLVLTWVATGLVFVSQVYWIYEFFAGRGRRERALRRAKHG